MSVSVFVPGHITGFFSIFDNKDPLLNGSCGAGFLLNKGVTTTIKTSTDSKTSIKINGKVDLEKDGIIKEVLKLMNIDDVVEINQNVELPIGAGFGTSASSALGVAIGLNNLLDLGNSIEKLGQIAHIAEINLGCGLGDVIAELGRGIVIRNSPGAPGIGKIQSMDEMEVYIGCKTFSQIKTSSIIQDDYYKEIISREGRNAQKRFLKDLSVENFLKESYNFSRDTKLMNKEVLEATKILNEDPDILGASMAMLGNTVFTFAHDRNALKNSEITDFEIYKLNNEGIIYD